MEHAYADSEARHAKQFDMLLNGFLKLEKMMQEHPPPTPPKNSPIDIISVRGLPSFPTPDFNTLYTPLHLR